MTIAIIEYLHADLWGREKCESHEEINIFIVLQIL